jgi:hypothetical protein
LARRDRTRGGREGKACFRSEKMKKFNPNGGGVTNRGDRE